MLRSDLDESWEAEEERLEAALCEVWGVSARRERPACLGDDGDSEDDLDLSSMVSCGLSIRLMVSPP